MDIAALYDHHIADSYDAEPFGLLTGGRGVAIAQLQRQLLQRGPTTSPVVVDLALGTGDSLLAAGALVEGATLHGIDISAGMIARAQQKLPRVHAIHDDAAKLTEHFPARSIDVALMHFLTTYIDAPPVIADVATTLKPGGLLSLVSTTWESFPGVHALALQVMSADELRRLNPAPGSGEALAAMMRDAGLEVVEQETFEKEITFDSAPSFALWGMQSGFFTHVLSTMPAGQLDELSTSMDAHFPLHDRYRAAALLARKPA